MSEPELAIRIAHLERKVSDLYRRLGQAEPDVDVLVTGEPDPRVVELIRQRKQIDAIKLQAELTGSGLAEAKDEVDRIALVYAPKA